MAKQTRTEKAQAALDNAWSPTPLKRRGGSSRVSYRRRNREREGLYMALLRVCKTYGVKVYLMDEAERGALHTYRRDGDTFTASGFFRAPKTIKLRYRSPAALAHELAHALDYQLGTGYRGSEAVATAVETLVMGCACKDYRTNVDYAAKQGSNAHEYAAACERISVIHGCIADALSFL